MKSKSIPAIKKTANLCKVVAGTHAGKSGTVRDISRSKPAILRSLLKQKNGVRFKTLGRNVVIEAGGKNKISSRF